MNNLIPKKKLFFTDERIAIIDIGSSSVRLVIFDEQKFSASVIFNEKVTLNLGKGIFMKRIDESEQNLALIRHSAVYTHTQQACT